MNRICTTSLIFFGLATQAMLIGCSGPATVHSDVPTQMPTLQLTNTATPIPISQPTEVDTPTPVPVTTETPTPMSTATPHPTPEWAFYEDESYTIVFQRDGELWLSEIDGWEEWPLTNEGLYTGEGPSKGVSSFAVSPNGQSIAYIVRDEHNDYVKVVNVLNSNARVVGSTSTPDRVVNFGFSSGPLVWWDDTHIAYYVFEPPTTREDDTIRMKSLIVVDTETGENTVEPFSTFQYPSPDGRYVLSELPHQLYDRETGEQWIVIEEKENASFLRWSPDGRLMIFSLTYKLEESGVSDLRILFVVDAETHTRWVVTSEDKVALNAVWSPDGQTITYLQCDPPTTGCGNPELWLTSPDGTNRHRIPMEESIHCTQLSWTPDGSRLVFETTRDPSIWSVRLDGTDLRSIADGQNPQVLPVP